MLQFKPINVDTIIETSEFMNFKISRTSDYTIGSMYMWREFYDTHYTIYEGMILYKVKFLGRTSFTFPAGVGPMDKLMDELKLYCKQNNIPLWFCTVPEEAIPVLVDNYKGTIPAAPSRDWSDYLYLAEDLSRSLELLPYIHKFGLIGGFLQVDDSIVAMSVGETINDTLYCHIEKADRNYQGSYQMIVKEFSNNSITDQVKYINREEDVGDEGLRTSKLSYHPHKLLEKYCVLIPL